jgi:hypothetical protein
MTVGLMSNKKQYKYAYNDEAKGTDDMEDEMFGNGLKYRSFSTRRRRWRDEA